MTPDCLHLHVGGYHHQGSLSLPTQGAAYHPPAALMYILHDVLAEGEHQAPNSDMAWMGSQGQGDFAARWHCGEQDLEKPQRGWDIGVLPATNQQN